MDEACCTCAKLLSQLPPQYDEKTEKPLGEDRQLECCNRKICGSCIANNKRFATYCPFCQVSTAPTSLPQGLRDPPAYSPNTLSKASNRNEPMQHGQPPPYTATSSDPEKNASEPAEDVLHFVHPIQDSLPSLALRYGVPIDALRRKNGLFSDHLLPGRKTILIPGEHYKGGVSLSPQPIEGEEEELRKSKVRRWMMACKVADVFDRCRYDVAVLYLKQSEYHLESAIEAYNADERWERDHPLHTHKMSKRVVR